MSSIVQAIPFNSFSVIDPSGLDYMFSPLISRIVNQSKTKVSIEVFIEQTRLEYYPNEDFSFIPELMSWVGRNNDIFIPEYHLITYGIFSENYKTNQLKDKVKELMLIEDYHYRIDTLTKKDNYDIKKEYGLVDPNSGPPTRGFDPSVYYFSPNAFKSILMSSLNAKKHQNYLKLFQTISIFYTRYELIVSNTERDAAQLKVLALESENQNLWSQINKLQSMVDAFTNTDNVPLMVDASTNTDNVPLMVDA